MGKRIVVSVVAIVAALRLALPVRAQVDSEVIYGSDDRIDLYQTKDARLLKMADSTVALFSAGSITPRGARALLNTMDYGPSLNLCRDERFYDQITGAFCSGSLVAPDVVMTAGHCIKAQIDCDGAKLVFGFAVNKKGKLPREVAMKDVYSCTKILGREQVDDGADWALIKLDRPVKDHAPLKINKAGNIKEKTPLVVIGHPAGLPTKIAGGAKVTSNTASGYFVADLDTYGGNSGSAVFNAKTGLIEGILVRGETDYVSRGSCVVSNVCKTSGCRGEDVTRANIVAAKLPAARHRGRVAELDETFASALDAVSDAR
ncbi:MAG: serine protease [Elusimicrobiota bacterium]